MTFEEKRKFLELYHDICLDMIITLQGIKDAHTEMLPGGQKISDMPKSQTQRDQMADFAVRVDRLERKHHFLLKAAWNIRDSVNATENIDQRFALTKYYLADGYTWAKIGQLLHVGERQAKNIGHNGIEQLTVKDPKNAKAILSMYGWKKE